MNGTKQDLGTLSTIWAWGALASLAYAGMVLTAPWSERLGPFFVLYACAFASCWGASQTRAGLVPIVLGALLFRALLVPLQPSLSDDVYRYVWEGRVQAAGVNPYVLAPRAPELEPLRDANWSRINHPEATAIYPPLAQHIFRGLASLGGVTLFKAAFVTLDLGLVALIAAMLRARHAPMAHLALYAWNPLAVVEVAGSGHLEPLALLPMLAAVLWVQRRPAFAWCALAACVAVKYAGVLVAPFLVRARRPHAWAVVAALLLLGALTLPYASAGAGLFASLRLYAAKWRFNDLLFLPLPALTGTLERAKLVASLLALAALGGILRRRVGLERSAQLLFCAALLISPTIHPWYLLWPVVFLPLVPTAPLFLWSGSVVFAYLFVFPAWDLGPFEATSLTPRVLEVVPVALGLVTDLRRGARFSCGPGSKGPIGQAT